MSEAPQSSSVQSMIELTDSDILTVEKVLQVLNQKVGTSTNMDGFRREIIERFAEARFLVDALCFTTNQQGTYIFEIVIKDRLEGEFDPDQMVWEATNDILELDGVNGGVIKSAPVIAQHQHKHSAQHQHKHSPMDHKGGKGKLWVPPGSTN